MFDHSTNINKRTTISHLTSMNRDHICLWKSRSWLRQSTNIWWC